MMNMGHVTTVLRAFPILLAGFFLQPVLAEEPAFEAASVKLLGPDGPKVPLFSGGPGSGDPGRIHFHVNMALLLGAAFGVSADQINGPAWLRDFAAMPFYGISATMPADSSKEQLERMLQNLLSERFHLLFRHETRNLPGYELVVDRGGPRLKEVVPDPHPMDGPQPVSSLPMGSDGFAVIPGPRTLGWRTLSVHQRIKDQEWSMADLARQLGPLIGRSLGKSVDEGFPQPRVVDNTGLSGKYTFILEYECPACVPLVTTSAASPDQGNSSPPNVQESGFSPDIFVAVQKELGLKLIKGADVAMDVIMVQALDKTPTEN